MSLLLLYKRFYIVTYINSNGATRYLHLATRHAFKFLVYIKAKIVLTCYMKHSNRITRIYLNKTKPLISWDELGEDKDD